MAILHNPLPEYIHGSVEGLIVIKHWLGKTIITSFPNMSRVVFSEKQRAEQRRFADAVAYAKAIVKNPQMKAVYQARLPKGKKVFNAVIAEYMKKEKLLKENSSESVQVQLSYAQKPLLLNQNRSRTESGPTKGKCQYLLRVFGLKNFLPDENPPGTS